MNRYNIILPRSIWRITLAFAVALIVFSVDAFGQEPEFKWKVYYVLDDRLAPLESLPYSKRAKGGITKNKSLVEVKEAKSPLRFSTPPVFAVKVADSDLDPNQQLSLYRMESHGGKRSTQLKAVGIYSGSTQLNTSEVLEFVRYGDNSLLIKAGALVPGEYGFFLPFSNQLFLFGID